MCHSPSCSLVDPSTRKRRVTTSKMMTTISGIESHALIFTYADHDPGQKLLQSKQMLHQ